MPISSCQFQIGRLLFRKRVDLDFLALYSGKNNSDQRPLGLGTFVLLRVLLSFQYSLPVISRMVGLSPQHLHSQSSLGH